MKLELDEETAAALSALLNGVEDRRQYPQEVLTYRQEKVLGRLAQVLRFEVAADKKEPLYVQLSPEEADVFTTWDQVLLLVSADLRSKALGNPCCVDTLEELSKLFYETCTRLFGCSSVAAPDLGLHVEPVFGCDGLADSGVAVLVQLYPKTSLGRRYIVSRHARVQRG